MKLLFFSSNPNHFDSSTMHHFNYPSNTVWWSNFLKNHSNYEITFVTQLPGMFLLDCDNNEISEKNESIKYILLPENATVSEFVEKISNEKPDFCIAASFWQPPFDWLPVQDSIIGESLKNLGFNVYCHSTETSLTCLDKYKTMIFLKNHNFNCAKGVYVSHELFWAERNKHEIINNVYKDAVFSQIYQLKLPLIIKDTCGLSSFGMEVCKTYGQVKNFLTSKKNNSDRIVEEFIDGIQFGTEIYSFDQETIVFPPFMFSVNQYGITSPKQSVKAGPVLLPEFQFQKLEQILKKMAKELQLSGFAQVDLVYSNNEWYILEINPRLSGMTELIRCHQQNPESLLLAIKFPVLSKQQIHDFIQKDYILHLNQILNDAALQQREQGYCEVIIPADKLETIKKDFPQLMEEVFYVKAKEMLNMINDA